jgi:hypothetical protein
MYYCRPTRLPPLTALVVNQTTGLPGDGLIADDLNGDRERVFGCNWYAIRPPSARELSECRDAVVKS